MHLRMAFRLLQSHLHAAQPNKREVSLRSPPQSTTDVLAATLVRLDADLTATRDEDTYGGRWHPTNLDQR